MIDILRCLSSAEYDALPVPSAAAWRTACEPCACGLDGVTENQRGENSWQNDIQREWDRP